MIAGHTRGYFEINKKSNLGGGNKIYTFLAMWDINLSWDCEKIIYISKTGYAYLNESGLNWHNYKNIQPYGKVAAVSPSHTWC